MNNKYANNRPSIPANVIRAVKVESGHLCAIKGCVEHTYLEIHHIDFNRENNDVENLILLCGKHHKMAHASVIDRKSLHEYKRLNSISNATNSIDSEDKKPDSSLRIVDLFEVLSMGEAETQATRIEVKFRNIGKEVIFLKEIVFETNKHWEIFTDRYHSSVNVSAEYDVDISEKVGFRDNIKIHHEIKPQETERIQIRLSTNYHSDPSGLSLFLLNMEFVFNEDSSRVSSGPVIINIRPKTHSRGSYFPCYSPGTISKNKAVAQEVIDLKSKGVYVEDYVIKALVSWLDAPSEKEYFNDETNET